MRAFLARLKLGYAHARALAALRAVSECLTNLRASSDNQLRVMELEARILISQGDLLQAQSKLRAALALYHNDVRFLERPELLRMLAFVSEGLHGRHAARPYYAYAIATAAAVYDPNYASAWRSTQFPSWFLAEFIAVEVAHNGENA